METVIRNVRIFDGEQPQAHRADVLLRDDRIARIARIGPKLTGEPGHTEVDGTGKTLLPGLIDAHTHAFDGSLAQALRFGVTTELDLFSVPANQRRLRRAAEGDDVADLRTAGLGATAPNGHPIQIMSDVYGPIDTVAGPGQASAFVAARVAEGSDFLKIVIDDGSASGQTIPCLSPQTVAALVHAAHDAGLKTIAHVATERDTKIALEAGIDGLAHLFTDAGPDSDLAATLAGQAANQGVFVISTLAFTEVLTGDGAGNELVHDPRIAAHLPRAAIDAVDRELTGFPVHPDGRRNALHAARMLYQAGVPLLAGTDANDGPHGGFAAVHGASLHRELVLLTEAGLTPSEALAAATSVPARLFDLTDRGRIAAGLRADLVLVDGDPTRDITATRSIADVWRRGVRQPALVGSSAGK
jgi:imidazolonepropionase-like amidohydrolase